jgi:hypothetical protein
MCREAGYAARICVHSQGCFYVVCFEFFYFTVTFYFYIPLITYFL